MSPTAPVRPRQRGVRQLPSPATVAKRRALWLPSPASAGERLGEGGKRAPRHSLFISSGSSQAPPSYLKETSSLTR